MTTERRDGRHAELVESPPTTMATTLPAQVLDFPLLQALFGRRARRFGLGMEIPSGPLAYRSTAEPLPLSELEQLLLVAAGTGVSGWSFGVPFGPLTPASHGEFTLRFTGRTSPTAAGLGTPALFFTDDDGCYCTRTRDVRPERVREYSGERGDDGRGDDGRGDDGRGDDEQDDDEQGAGRGIDGHGGIERLLEVCRQHTIRIRDARLDLPSEPPHVLPPNLWWANKPGSTLFMPVADASEEALGLLALMTRHGVMVIDDDTGEPAGNLEPFVRSGLLNREKRLPLSEFQGDIHECVCLETAFMGHNIMLMMQAMGLGGLFFNGMDSLSVLGARAAQGIAGLGFRYTEDERWVNPNPVGLDGVYEALCPPYYPDMHAAVEAFVERKFGSSGAYADDGSGPWRDPATVKRSVEPYHPEFVDCLSEVARYIHDKHGKFPGTRSTIVLPGFVQAQHLDTGFYDTHYQDGAYLRTHAEHMERWHGDGSG